MAQFPVATTNYFGEEDPQPTQYYGEECGCTTNALGEEGGPTVPDDGGTDAFGGF
ncbi:MAG TPA: hypothetical protein VE913_15155 [Longimicrobium sp.]|nr:hypothetical protein [Longimicrobium sp.]